MQITGGRIRNRRIPFQWPTCGHMGDHHSVVAEMRLLRLKCKVPEKVRWDQNLDDIQLLLVSTGNLVRDPARIVWNSR